MPSSSAIRSSASMNLSPTHSAAGCRKLSQSHSIPGIAASMTAVSTSSAPDSTSRKAGSASFTVHTASGSRMFCQSQPPTRPRASPRRPRDSFSRSKAPPIFSRSSFDVKPSQAVFSVPSTRSRPLRPSLALSAAVAVLCSTGPPRSAPRSRFRSSSSSVPALPEDALLL